MKLSHSTYDTTTPVPIRIPAEYRVPKRLGLPFSNEKDALARFSSRDRQGQANLIRDYQMKFQAARRSSSVASAAAAALGMAVLYENTLELKKAIQWYNLVLATCDEDSVPEEQKAAMREVSHNALAMIFEHQGDSTQAVFHSKHHRKCALSPLSRVLAFSNEGLGHRNLGNIHEALDKHKRGLAEAREMNDPQLISLLNAQIAQDGFMTLDSTAAASHNCDEYYEAESKTGNDSSRLQAASLMGQSAEQAHDYNKAALLFEEAMDVAIAIKDQSAITTTKVHIGMNHANARLQKVLAEGHGSEVVLKTLMGK